MAKKVQVVGFSEFTRAKASFLHNPHGTGRYPYLRRLIDLVWPDADIDWNSWLEDQLKSLCGDEGATQIGDVVVRNISWTGCGGGGKTFAAGLYAMAWFLCVPEESCVTLTSTSKTSIGFRVWPVIQHLFLCARDPDTGERFPWHIVDSEKQLQWPRGNRKNSVAAFAVEPGELLKSIDKIKGRHTPRMLVIIDEATSTPEAIFKTIPNMLKGCKELIVLTIGNAISRFDNHGRCCEPKDGWGSVNVDMQKWETRGVPEWGLFSGLCLHYDGERSPNVIAGKTLHPRIYSYENWLQDKRFGTHTVHYWSQTRGFWTPDGTINTVLNETAISKYDATGHFVFVSQRIACAALDPAFGGDECIEQFGDIGDLVNGKMALQLSEWIVIRPDVRSRDEIDYQIARKFIEDCKKRGVQPKYSGVDATGIGRGVYAIVAAEWSQEVQRVEFGGAPSDMPAGEVDPRPAKEVYDRKVTELWYSVREFVLAEQLKGLYPESIVQFCTREYEDLGKRVRIDTKDECKQKIGRSPDHADAISILVEVARRNGLTSGGKVSVRKKDTWQKLLKEANSVYSDHYREEGEFNMTADS